MSVNLTFQSQLVSLTFNNCFLIGQTNGKSYSRGKKVLVDILTINYLWHTENSSLPFRDCGSGAAPGHSVHSLSSS